MKTTYMLSELLAKRPELLSGQHEQKVVLMADNGDVPNQVFAWKNCLPFVLSSTKMRAFMHEMQGFLPYVNILQVGNMVTSKFEISEDYPIKLKLTLVSVADEMKHILNFAENTSQLKIGQDGLYLPMRSIINYEKGFRKLVGERLQRRKEIKQLVVQDRLKMGKGRETPHM